MFSISKKRLRALVKEAVQSKLNGSSDKEVLKDKDKEFTGAGKFASKVDTFVSDSIKSIDDLIKEAEEMLMDNPTHDYAIQERNHSLMTRVGMLKSFKNFFVRAKEVLIREI